MELFDKNGNKISITNVIHLYLETKAIKYNKDIEDIYIGFDGSKWNVNKAPSIYTVEVSDNSYDGKNVDAFGDEDILEIDFNNK
jgi:hypothetical protein